MPYTPSLDPRLYVDANQDIDAYYRELMRGQDQTPTATDHNKPRFTIVVGPSPFSMPRGWEFFLTAPMKEQLISQPSFITLDIPLKLLMLDTVQIHYVLHTSKSLTPQMS